MAMIFVIGVLHLPKGPCFDDPGDLQTSCSTLGIAHPPGYAGFVLVGWLLTKVFFFLEPAYVVSLACAACVTIALGLLMAMLVRIGLHVTIACCVGLVLLAHHTPWQSSVWQSLVSPEVYAAAWLLLIGSVSLLMRYGRTGRVSTLLLAAGLYGFLVANRTSSLMFAPGYLLGWAAVEWRRGTPFGRAVSRFFALTGAFVVAGLTVALIALWQDSPETEYNAIELHREGCQTDLMAWSADPAVRWERFRWLVTAEVFHEHLAADFSHAPSKLRWIRRVLFVFERGPFAAAMVLLVLGLILLARRGIEWSIVAVGVIAGNVVFLCVYRIYDQAANLMPIMFGAALPAGAVLAVLFPAKGRRGVLGGTLLFFACAGSIYHATQRYNYGEAYDATEYLAEVHLEDFPQDSAIMTSTLIGAPLWYERLIRCDRKDIHIVENNRRHWARLAVKYLDRPVFYTRDDQPAPEGWRLEPFHNMWRLVKE